MHMDCQWIDKNLEALFSGTLSQDDQQRAERHIENCGSCAKEVAALNSIDPLVKKYFQNELYQVQAASPRRLTKARLVAVSSVALLTACLLLAIGLRTSPPHIADPSSAFGSQSAIAPQPPDTVP